MQVSLIASVLRNADCYTEVDAAVEASQHDGTGGRGLNGHISNALEEQRDSTVIRNAV